MSFTKFELSCIIFITCQKGSIHNWTRCQKWNQDQWLACDIIYNCKLSEYWWSSPKKKIIYAIFLFINGSFGSYSFLLQGFEKQWRKSNATFPSVSSFSGSNYNISNFILSRIIVTVNISIKDLILICKISRSSDSKLKEIAILYSARPRLALSQLMMTRYTAVCSKSKKSSKFGKN